MPGKFGARAHYSPGQIERLMQREGVAVTKGSTAAVKKETETLKLAIRAEINQAFTGSARVGKRGNRRVANAIRSRIYAKDKHRPAMGLVYSKFGGVDPISGRFIDYLLPHVTGATIRPKRGRFLRIGLTRKGRVGILPVETTPTLAMIPQRDGTGLVIARTTKKGRVTKILAILEPEVRIPARLNFEPAILATMRALAGVTVDEIEQAARANTGSPNLAGMR